MDEHTYKEILENLYDGVYLVAPDRRIKFWNKGAERITGFSAGQVVGHFCQDNILNHVTEEGVALCLSGCPLHATIQDGKERQAEVYLHHADGHRLPVIVRTSPIYDPDGNIIGATEIFSDNRKMMSMRRRIDTLEESSLQDPLTKISNRRHAELRLTSALQEFQQHAIPFGLLFIDIDLFKDFNDRYGHEIGDQALIMVTHTLHDNLRSSDLVGRWGGDELVIILESVDRENLRLIAEKLRRLVETSSLRTAEGERPVTISVGATLARPDDDPASLLERADKAMYHSKQNGCNQVTVSP